MHQFHVAVQVVPLFRAIFAVSTFQVFVSHLDPVTKRGAEKNQRTSDALTVSCILVSRERGGVQKFQVPPKLPRMTVFSVGQT